MTAQLMVLDHVVLLNRFFADAFATLSTWFILSKANVLKNDKRN